MWSHIGSIRNSDEGGRETLGSPKESDKSGFGPQKAEHQVA